MNQVSTGESWNDSLLSPCAKRKVKLFCNRSEPLGDRIGAAEDAVRKVAAASTSFFCWFWPFRRRRDGTGSQSNVVSGAGHYRLGDGYSQLSCSLGCLYSIYDSDRNDIYSVDLWVHTRCSLLNRWYNFGTVDPVAVNYARSLDGWYSHWKKKQFWTTGNIFPWSFHYIIYHVCYILLHFRIFLKRQSGLEENEHATYDVVQMLTPKSGKSWEIGENKLKKVQFIFSIVICIYPIGCLVTYSWQFMQCRPNNSGHACQKNFMLFFPLRNGRIRQDHYSLRFGLEDFHANSLGPRW